MNFIFNFDWVWAVKTKNRFKFLSLIIVVSSNFSILIWFMIKQIYREIVLFQGEFKKLMTLSSVDSCYKPVNKLVSHWDASKLDLTSA